MKNVAITLDKETAAWVRAQAARRNVSVSRYVGERLRQHMRQSHEYDQAMQRFLNREPVKLKRFGERYPTREGLYYPPGLRRR